MFKNIIEKIFGSSSSREIKSLQPIVDRVNELEKEIKELSDEEIKGKLEEFKNRHSGGETLEELMPEAFAVAREASRRNVGMRHFDVQLIGGAVLFQGKIAEMATGEGKTLVAILPVYLQSIAERNIHVVTVNDYLAMRDAEWMRPAYRALGLTVGFVQSDMKPPERKKAYACDVVYVTNNEIGFDYLRDNMAIRPEQQVQGELEYAIIDEVDSVLIDEARTPLIISGPAEKSSDKYYKADRVIPFLKMKEFNNYEEEQQYKEKVKKTIGKEDVDEGQLMEALDRDGFHGKLVHKDKSVSFTTSGQKKIEELLGIKMFTKENEYKTLDTGEWMHHINQALKAHKFFKKDVHYIIKEGQVVIVDEFTGRLMPGRRWSDGLHQAVEAKEKLKIKRENQTLASVTFQNFFNLYDKLSGMTGTAMTEQSEFHKIYDLLVVEIPTNRELQRTEAPDAIYMTEKEKFNAVVEAIKELNEKGSPVLVGSRSIDVSERIGNMLRKRGIKHTVLNAKYHMREAEIIAQAGRLKAVTISTNMAGRGTDIILGGNPGYLARQEMEREDFERELIVKAAEKTPPENKEEEEAKKVYQKYYERFKEQTDREQKKVIEKGGLHVIGTERHESRRIDNQLRGRAGRQGDPGFSKFFVSLEDELMKLFGGDRIMTIMNKIGGHTEGEKMEHALITRSIEKAQKLVEAMNFDIRKQLLDYDNVMDKQRRTIYTHRNRILRGEDIKEEIMGFIEDYVDILLEENIPLKTRAEEWDTEKLESELITGLGINIKINSDDFLYSGRDGLRSFLEDNLKESYEKRKEDLGKDKFAEMERMLLLQVIDHRWKEHLYDLDQVKESVRLSSFAQKDPLVEYKRESFMAFEQLMDSIKREVIRYLFRASAQIISSKLKGYGTRQRAEKPDAEIPKESLQSAIPTRAGRGGQPSKTKVQQRVVKEKVGRNDPCPCGSGRKYKHCCGG